MIQSIIASLVSGSVLLVDSTVYVVSVMASIESSRFFGYWNLKTSVLHVKAKVMSSALLNCFAAIRMTPFLTINSIFFPA